MGSLSKLPPEVARELRRHVSPRPLKSMQAKKAAELEQQQSANSSSKWVLAGCLAFTGTAFSIPFIAQQWISNLNARDEPLTGAQIRRGAFQNSGSKDAGKDPQWDFVKGQYKKDENYWAIFDNNAAQKAFGNIVSTPAENKKNNASKTAD